MNKIIFSIFSLMFATKAFAVDFSLRGDLGYVLHDYAFKDGEVSKFKGPVAHISLPVSIFALSPKTSLTVAPGVKGYYLQCEEEKTLDAGRTKYSHTSKPALWGGDVALRFRDSSYGFELFGSYHRVLKGTFQFKMYTYATNYESKTDFNFASFAEMQVGIRGMAAYSSNVNLLAEVGYTKASAQGKMVGPAEGTLDLTITGLGFSLGVERKL